MKKSQYRDREGGLHFNITINEVELTAICTALKQYTLLDMTSRHHKETQEYVAEIIKDLESS